LCEEKETLCEEKIPLCVGSLCEDPRWSFLENFVWAKHF
jgi:hypothetical protein